MPVRELQHSPGMLPMFARAGAAMIPGASRLPFVGGGGGELPDVTYALPGVVVDRDRLGSYNRVCGFSLRDALPPTYPHILAFALHLKLMTDPSFPFAAIGLVHIANTITQHRPIDASESLDIRVWAADLLPHPKGWRFSIRSEARVGDELVWEAVSINLHRGGGGEADAGTGPEVPSGEGSPASATWKLAGDLGRRYGSVSGDLNPIHMHSLSARLFGFPSAIAHGMWTKARCLAALSARLPDAFTVAVAFKRPILLPAVVDFAEAPGEEGIRFGVRDRRKETPHLDGFVSGG